MINGILCIVGENRGSCGCAALKTKNSKARQNYIETDSSHSKVFVRQYN